MIENINDKANQIHQASMTILSKCGIKIHNAEALAIFKSNGIRTDHDIAYFSEEEIMHWVSKAPRHFTIYAADSDHNVYMGEDTVNFAPGYGCAFIADRDGVQRDATIEDYVKCAKLYHANRDFHIVGGIMVQPSDVPQKSSAVDMFYSVFTHTDKVLFLATGDKRYMDAILDSIALAFGGRDAIIEQPRAITLVNTNAPLGLDNIMLDVIMTFAHYGQPVIISASTMLGTTGPVTIAGTLACSNAEVLAGVALTQMIRPGTPVVYGMQSTAADMKTGQIAGASPEGTILQGFGAQMAKYYELPCRGGGCMSDAPRMTPQAGYEAMMTCFSAYMNKINFVSHSGGIVASFNAIQFEKMIMDFEVVRYVKRCFQGFDINSETLAMDLILEKGHDGEFLTTAHTHNFFKREILTPYLGTRGNIKDPVNDFDQKIEEWTKILLSDFERTKPQKNADLLDEIKTILETTGVSRQQLDYIETL